MDKEWQKFAQWASQADDATVASALKKMGGKIGNISVGDMRKFLTGADGSGAAFLKSLPGAKTKIGARMAGSGLAKGLGRIVPVLSVGANAMDVYDLATGEESFGNKAMDATFMVAGGVLGAAGGPLGASLGASTGKMISDGTQWLFGDKKSPEQRKMEEALKALQNGGLY